MTRAPAGSNIVFDPISLKMRSCTGWSPEDFRREWDYVGEVIAREGGEVIPMYFGCLSPKSFPQLKSLEEKNRTSAWSDLDSSGLLVAQQDIVTHV